MWVVFPLILSEETFQDFTLCLNQTEAATDLVISDNPDVSACRYHLSPEQGYPGVRRERDYGRGQNTLSLVAGREKILWKARARTTLVSWQLLWREYRGGTGSRVPTNVGPTMQKLSRQSAADHDTLEQDKPLSLIPSEIKKPCPAEIDNCLDRSHAIRYSVTNRPPSWSC